jgi:transcriptional regulator with GAF, ATPase, and Fis domain
MSTSPDFLPELDSLKLILLAFSREQRLEPALKLLVDRLVETRPRVVAAGVWLTEEVAEAVGVAAQSERDASERFLSLAASASRFPDDFRVWRHDGGTFASVPASEPLVGVVAASAQLRSTLPGEMMDPCPEWAKRRGICNYIAAPLVHQEHVLGVLAIFAEEVSDLARKQAEEAVVWMRLFCDHTAAAVANARALAEIRQLHHRLSLENEYLREEVAHSHSAGHILGESVAIKKVLEQIELVAPTDSNVLIEGESGTGKELVARALHEQSRRAERPLIKVNCASIPGELFESEFFGHIKGAFTGAVQDRLGRFQLADGGTLFLDEVGEIPLVLQGKLLRVLQDGEFERVGEDVTRSVDVRVLAATNRNLLEESKAKRFRQDLYYRLGVFPVVVPPLRERVEDVPELARHFVQHASRRVGVPEPELKPRHIRELQRYDWPGNVRELQNVIERAVVVSRTGVLRFDVASSQAATEGESPPATIAKLEKVLTYPDLKDLERETIVAALKETDGKVFGEDGAAELLRIKPTTLLSRMKKMGIPKSK